MTDIFLVFKNMDHQLSNALSTVFLRRLVILLNFETDVFENPQKTLARIFPLSQLSFLPQIFSTKKFDDDGKLLIFDKTSKSFLAYFESKP